MTPAGALNGVRPFPEALKWRETRQIAPRESAARTIQATGIYRSGNLLI